MTSITSRAVRTTAALASIAALGTGLAGTAAALPGVGELPNVPGVNVQPPPDEAAAAILNAPDDVSADVNGVPVLPPPDAASTLSPATDSATDPAPDVATADSLADQALAEEVGGTPLDM